MVLRQALLTGARSRRLRKLVSTMPVSSAIVARYVAGETADEAVEAARRLLTDGLQSSIDYLGEDTRDRDQATRATQSYLILLDRLHRAGLTRGAEISVKLSAVGRSLGSDGEKIALDNARSIADAARNAGTTVTLDMEDHTSVDATLSILHELRRDFPETGAVLQAYLHRTEADCRDLAHEGSRVRLCKGAYNEPASVAYQKTADVDRSYVRCLKILMAGQGYPMIATHDPRLIEIAGALAMRHDRSRGSYEFQMLYGIRPQEQRRLADLGDTVRVYVPYGDEWYAYLMRRMAERPANTAFFLRSLLTRT
ncbi:proline dehydrogenase family protein [Actinopolymorpha singaporensis]|uniref:proline dehydrogenase n=1 Tax=Actinopolymorpha singaporensis TaxID=117157 RepID=A0A1H1QMA5_9ACTN|nr:L-proline dehydrogenase [Actinopolymorpha singaporensis]